MYLSLATCKLKHTAQFIRYILRCFFTNVATQQRLLSTRLNFPTKYIFCCCFLIYIATHSIQTRLSGQDHKPQHISNIGTEQEENSNELATFMIDYDIHVVSWLIDFNLCSFAPLFIDDLREWKAESPSTRDFTLANERASLDRE